MSARTLSEKQRAFHALKGDVYPRVGDRGIFSEGFGPTIDAAFEDDVVRTVEVLRVSESGKTIWTRFVHPDGYVQYGRGREPQRWLRGAGDGVFYWGQEPFGEVKFR